MLPSVEKLKVWLYIVCCATALLYLGIANARGYVPFSSQSSMSPSHTANHFHK